MKLLNLFALTSMLVGFDVVMPNANAQSGPIPELDQCRYQCSQRCVRTARRLRRQAREILDLCVGNPGPGPGPGPTPNPYPPAPTPGYGYVQVHKSDSCNGSLVATIGPETRCNQFSNSGSDAWAISIDGQCKDISDISLGKACRMFKNYSPYAAKVYKSDSCGSSLIAIMGPETSCNEFDNYGSDAWAIEINGQCTDISDTSVRKACNRFKHTGPTIFKSDSCSGAALMRLPQYKQPGFCDSISNSGSDAWAVRVQGKCYDISDTSPRRACKMFSVNPRRAVKVYKSDRCSSSLVAMFDAETNCSEFSSSGSDAWAVEVNGQCQDISDMSVRDACRRFGGY